jgi:uncharacterized protein (TIGR00255 family)
MIQSMTAYSQVQCQLDSVILSWEIRSLNHRYLDVSFRLPESLRYIETNLRQCLRGKINRGKLDCQLKISEIPCNAHSLKVNHQMVKSLLQEASQLTSEYQLADDLQLSQVLFWPGVLEQHTSEFDDLAMPVERLFQEGLEQLLEGKRTEGMALEQQIQMRLTLLRKEIEAAKTNTESTAIAARNKLLKRLEDLQMKVVEPRIEQEIAVMLTRLDVSEELDRLNAHVDEVGRTLNGSESTGKRLDFLMQELNREANTLSSKSDSVVLSRHAVEMKVLIEQMREQIQNIE